MPYYDIEGHTGEPITRVTEPLSSEYRAWLDQNHPKKWNRPKRIDFSSIRGTSVHQIIEDYVCDHEEIPRRPKRPRDPLELEVIKRDLEKPYYEQIITPQVKRCKLNFLKYWVLAKSRYELEVLLVEIRVFSPKYLIAGTLDILMKIRIEDAWFLAILDWKSGSMFSDTYGLQLSAYREFLLEDVKLGKIILPDLPFYSHNFCVLLGGSQPVEHQTIHDFKGYLKYYERYKNPENRCDGKTCVYCPDLVGCPHCSVYRKQRFMKRLGHYPTLDQLKGKEKSQ